MLNRLAQLLSNLAVSCRVLTIDCPVVLSCDDNVVEMLCVGFREDFVVKNYFKKKM